MNRPALHFHLFALFVYGCSSDPATTSQCSATDCQMDAGTTGKILGPDGGRIDSGVRVNNFVISDAGEPAELQARLQITGNNVQCGACAILLVQAQGGKQPYTYQWSDPSLNGPGPHSVCPTQATSYSVLVTDSTPASAGEFSMTAQQAEADGTVTCVADAGLPSDDFQGCITPVARDAGADAGDAGYIGIQCSDGGVNFDVTTGAVGDVVVSANLAKTFANLSRFKAGHSYTYVADRLLPLTLAWQDGVQIDGWGASGENCDAQEHLFTVHYDLLSWHQAACFTPSRDYDNLIIRVHLGGVLVYFDVLESQTFCAGCVQ